MTSTLGGSVFLATIDAMRFLLLIGLLTGCAEVEVSVTLGGLTGYEGQDVQMLFVATGENIPKTATVTNKGVASVTIDSDASTTWTISAYLDKDADGMCTIANDISWQFIGTSGEEGVSFVTGLPDANSQPACDAF